MNRTSKVVALFAGLCLLAPAAARAAQDQPAMTYLKTKADESAKKLESIEKTQQDILNELAEIRKELNVVKIRATQ
ncbi:MAG: hypothetical protein WC352_04400 [Candidatus Omnitrophota bacterium]